MKSYSENYGSSLNWFTSYDQHLFSEGTHLSTYNKLGAHPGVVNGVHGVYFSVWAPNAKSVSVIGDFNYWSDNSNPLSCYGDCGVWGCFVPEAKVGQTYKYCITSQYDGSRLEKADPYAFHFELRPKTASVVWDISGYKWNDEEWMSKRGEVHGLNKPFSIYEVHLGSWRRKPEDGGGFLSYRELAETLPAYLSGMGFTHVQFMPITEHPFDGSWGYQTVGYFAPTSRFGTPQDFMFLIDKLHEAGIGVLMDWVPAHFPSDEHGLFKFDGTHLYEHADPRLGYHPDWSSYIFNFGRTEVSNFLLSSALFWFDKYHIDGLRVDAVASMLYLDYSRKDGEWIPNAYGGRENLDAIAFLKRMNEVIYDRHPDVITVAEESTAWPAVSRPTYVGGLGFMYKWNMGWMNDVLSYFSKDPVYRAYHHSNLTFGLLYAFHENFVLPFSHDEVVHGKCSLLRKMPGDDWQKYANLRLLFGFMYGHPGKKLIFMGGEFAQWDEWNHDKSLDWHLLQYEPHQGIQLLIKDLNNLLKVEPALYELDSDYKGFSWIDCSDGSQSIISFLRHSSQHSKNFNSVLCIYNFTPVTRYNYRIGVPTEGYWEELINTDSSAYWGGGIGNMGGVFTEQIPSHGHPFSLNLILPPLSAILLKFAAI